MKKIFLFILIFLATVTNLHSGQISPSSRFERYLGVVKQTNIEKKEFVLKLADGSLRKAYLASEAWLHFAGSFQSPDEKYSLLKDGINQLISVGGIVYSDKPDEIYVNKDVIIFGQNSEELHFEGVHWWDEKAKLLSEFWLKAQSDIAPETISYKINPQLYRTEISQEGNKVVGTYGRKYFARLQETATLSRLIYGLCSTYILTGDSHILEAARAYVEYQRKYMRRETKHGDVYWIHALEAPEKIDEKSNPQNWKDYEESLYNEDKDTIPLYEQIYCLAGLTQYFRITGDSAISEDIEKTIQFMNRYYWDSNQVAGLDKGYFSHIRDQDFSWDNPTLSHNRAKKNWNSVGDHIPAYLLNYYLATKNMKHIVRMLELGDIIAKHFPDPESPFVYERFNREWLPDTTYGWQQNRAVIGHNLKIVWCLTRLLFLLESEEDSSLSKGRIEKYKDIAESLAKSMQRHGEDLLRGGWFDVRERTINNTTGRYEFVWHNRKSWWQQEQGILAYYIMYGATKNEDYLKTARFGSAFYNLAFWDLRNGDVFFDVQENGIPFFDDDQRLLKGSHAKSGYHSMELCYFAHLYTNLLVTKNQVTLHFSPKKEIWGKEFHVQPIAFPKNSVIVKSVSIDGVDYKDFNPKTMVINLPTSPESHSIKVVLTPMISQ